MTRFLPIPRKDLPHRAVLLRSREGAWEPGEPLEIPLDRVRVQGSRGLSWTGAGERGSHGLTLFHDCVNSRPRAVCYRPGDRVRFGGGEYAVAEVQAVAGDCLGEPVHHWEVLLR